MATTPVAPTAAGDSSFAVAQAQTSTFVDCDAPPNTSVLDALVAYPFAQNNAIVSEPTATGWGKPGTTSYNVTGDAGRRPQIWLVKFVPDAATRDALLAAPTRFTNSNTNGGRWGVMIRRITGARLSDLATWATGAFNTGSTAGSPARTLPAATSPQADSLALAGFAAQMPSSPAPTTTSWDWTELSDVCTIGSTTTAHGVGSIAAKAVGSGSTGTATATTSQAFASASGYILVVPPADSPPPGPTPTTMKGVAHRATLGSAADTTENHPDGMDLLPAGTNAVELDGRLSSDGVLHACHDEAIDRTARNGDTGLVSSKTSAQLLAAGIPTMASLLEAAVMRGYNDVLVQSYTAAGNQSQMNAFVAVMQAAKLRQRITIMTSISGPYHPDLIRTAGWTGKIGTYGSTAANWSGAGAGKAADFTTYAITVAFLPPGAYTANRAHVATLIAAGVTAGASTENSSVQWAQAHADGVGLLLTDDVAGYLALYTPPIVVRDGQAAATLPAPTSAGSASTPANGTLAATLQPLTSAATASTPSRGTLAATVPALTSSATGATRIQGTVGSTLPTLTAAAAAAVPSRGILGSTLPTLATSAQGTVGSGVTGAVAATLPTLSAAAAASTRVAVALAAALPTLTTSVQAGGAAPVTGAVGTTVPPLTTAATAAAIVHATLVALLPALAAATPVLVPVVAVPRLSLDRHRPTVDLFAPDTVELPT